MKILYIYQLLVDNIGKLLVKIFFYFFQYGKRAFELEKLVTLFNVKALNLLCNVKTCWLSMFSPTNGVLVECKYFIM